MWVKKKLKRKNFWNSWVKLSMKIVVNLATTMLVKMMMTKLFLMSLMVVMILEVAASSKWNCTKTWPKLHGRPCNAVCLCIGRENIVIENYYSKWKLLSKIIIIELGGTSWLYYYQFGIVLRLQWNFHLQTKWNFSSP